MKSSSKNSILKSWFFGKNKKEHFPLFTLRFAFFFFFFPNSVVIVFFLIFGDYASIFHLGSNLPINLFILLNLNVLANFMV